MRACYRRFGFVPKLNEVHIPHILLPQKITADKRGDRVNGEGSTHIYIRVYSCRHLPSLQAVPSPPPSLSTKCRDQITLTFRRAAAQI